MCSRNLASALFGILGISLAPGQVTGAAFHYSEVLGIPGFISAMATDPKGNAYLAGVVGADTFPTTPGVFQPKFGGVVCLGIGPFSPNFPCQDAFVMKVDPDGEVVFATYLGGGGRDFATAIAVDAQGDIYVAGIQKSH